MKKSRLIKRLNSCAYSPPQGEWSWEVQRRCYCAAHFLKGVCPVEEWEIAYKTWAAWVQEAIEVNDNNLLGTCANHLSRGDFAPELEDHITSMLMYIVSGEYESIYVSRPILESSYKHIEELQRKWAEDKLKEVK